MDRRFEERKRELLEDCQVAPEVFQGMVRRLRHFARPFVRSLSRSQQCNHALQYCTGLTKIGRDCSYSSGRHHGIIVPGSLNSRGKLAGKSVSAMVSSPLIHLLFPSRVNIRSAHNGSGVAVWESLRTAKLASSWE